MGACAASVIDPGPKDLGKLGESEPGGCERAEADLPAHETSEIEAANRACRPAQACRWRGDNWLVPAQRFASLAAVASPNPGGELPKPLGFVLLPFFFSSHADVSHGAPNSLWPRLAQASQCLCSSPAPEPLCSELWRHPCLQGGNSSHANAPKQLAKPSQVRGEPSVCDRRAWHATRATRPRYRGTCPRSVGRGSQKTARPFARLLPLALCRGKGISRRRKGRAA